MAETRYAYIELHGERIPRRQLDVAKRKSRIAGLQGIFNLNSKCYCLVGPAPFIKGKPIIRVIKRTP